MVELITVIAVWRLTYMLTEDVGPYGIFTRLRLRLWQSKLVDFNCFYCTSIYISALFALFSNNFILYTLFYSGAAIIIETVLEKLDV